MRVSELIEQVRGHVMPRAEALKQRVQTQIDGIEAEVDPAYREECCELVEKLGRYFDPEVRGLSRLPAEGPYILVGNHSGGAYTPDAPIFMAAYLRHWGMDKPLHPLAHNVLFSIPQLGERFRRLGLIPANPDKAAQVLARGEPLLVYPGGDYESQRPFFESHLVDFGGRKGFIRLALEQGVPVIPFVCHGSNETVVTVTRGERLAKWTGLTYLTRTKVLPFRLGALGLVPSGVPYLPLPSKITIEVGHPMAWQGFTPADAENEFLVQALYDDIVGVMQRTLNGLYLERPNPYARRGQRFVAPQHSPPPKPPRKALALRARPVPAPADLAHERRTRSTRPPSMTPSRTSAA
jgi:1-acyl-sn-glycerol-3-phosphate acyltransferase